MNSHAINASGSDEPLPIGWSHLPHAHTEKPIMYYGRHEAVDPEFGLAILVCVGSTPFFYGCFEISRLFEIKFDQMEKPMRVAEVLATQAEHFGFFVVAARLHSDGLTLIFDESDNVKVVANLGVLHHSALCTNENAQDILSAAFAKMYAQHPHLRPRRQVSVPATQPAVMAA